MFTRNIFSKVILSFFIVFLLVFFSCVDTKKKEIEQQDNVKKEVTKKVMFKLSLAQWSLHKEVNDKGVSPFLFAKTAKDMGFQGLEYVSQLYNKEIENLGFDIVIDSLKVLSNKNAIQNVLIMVDGEGDLADPNEELRNLAVENHKKWIDAAEKLGCHSIRVNTFGTNNLELWKTTVTDGLRKLSTYAATKNINVLCENHGWLSSNAPELVNAIKAVNMPNCGTLPDFGNWCVKRVENQNWGDCLEEYPDKYQGMEILLPLAKAVSAKCYDFDAEGNETTIDFKRMVKLVKASGYNGFIGVEYEGKRLEESVGILNAKKLLLKHIN